MKSKKKIIVEACYTQQVNHFTRETIVTLLMPSFDGWEQYEVLEASEIPFTEWTKELKNQAINILHQTIEDISEWGLEYIEFIGEVD